MLLSYFIIALVSLFLNWFVQLGYYLYKKRQNPRAFVGQRTLLDYKTGYLGDGVIVPLINILIYYVIIKTGYRLQVYELVFAFTLALLIDILAHYLQGRLKLTNWSMPEPFRWNFAGHWHMVSFPIQITYILLYYYIVILYWNTLVGQRDLISAVAGAAILMLFFGFLYARDNRWI